MNHSDIRGLVRLQRAGADIDILGREFCLLRKESLGLPSRVRQLRRLSHRAPAYYSVSCPELFFIDLP